jgi:hypothetical protein
MSKTIDPNQLVTGQLRKLVDLLEAEKRDRFFTSSTSGDSGGGRASARVPTGP